MAKLRTSLVTGAPTSIATMTEDDETVEFVAKEDMKIVGCAFGTVNAAKVLTHITLARSGNQRVLYEYNDPRIIQDTDEPLFGTRCAFEDPSNNTDFNSKEIFLPSGDYFELEEGERLYLHAHVKNNDASSHTYLNSALLYWKK